MKKDTIIINTFKNGTFAPTEKIVPKYITDVKAFEKKVQTKYDALTRLELENKVTSLEVRFMKALKDEKISATTFKENVENYKTGIIELLDKKIKDIYYGVYGDFTDAKSNLEAFNEVISKKYENGVIPKIENRDITYYTWTVFDFKVELNITGLRATISDCINYGDKYLGSETWSKDRKTSFTEIKQSFASCLETAFNFSSADTEEYKPINVAANFPSRETEVVINAIYGSYKNKNTGVTLTHLKESQVTRQLILAFLHWQGCEVNTKKVTVKKLTALDV